ncbi:MAG TPA: extracellular solute-binding protein [Anaerolineales bacterium]|nr:extracellular solute-binding protein [Anaerolineales bacterium]
MSKNLFKLLALLIAVSTLLAACGGPAATTQAPSAATQAPAVTQAPQATEAPQATQSSGEKRVLKIWHYEGADSAMGQSWDSAMKDFQTAHPDVEIQFELKTFDQIQQTAQMILNSSDAPDVLEINKGNATAGLYAKQGLLTDLSDVATQRGWDKLLPSSIQTTCRYDENGIMGSGPLYGVTNYGEFVMVYYNKDMFKKNGIEVPTSLDEFNAAADKFVAAGITPLTLGGLDKWPVTQNFYELALYKADRNFINNYELFQGDVDFHGPEFTFAAQGLADQVKKGYYGTNATGTSYDDANAAFVQGKTPMDLTGSWMFGTFLSSIKDFDWGIFVMPGKKLNTGSGGNLWVVPAGAQNKDLAYDFIDLTLQPKAQIIMANAGGIPLSADLAQITDPHTKELNEAFSTIVKNDGLAFYPDWPAPGYMDTLGGGLQELISGTKTVPEFLDFIAGPWQEYKSSLP